MSDSPLLYVATSSYPDRDAAERFLRRDDFVFVHSDKVLEWILQSIRRSNPAEMEAPIRARLLQEYVREQYLYFGKSVVCAAGLKYQFDWQSIGAILLVDTADMPSA